MRCDDHHHRRYHHDRRGRWMAAHIRDRVPAESPDRDHDHHCDQSGHWYPADKRPEDGKQEEQEGRSAEHTSELQSLMRISYADFCMHKPNTPPRYRLPPFTTSPPLTPHTP